MPVSRGEGSSPAAPISAKCEIWATVGGEPPLFLFPGLVACINASKISIVIFEKDQPVLPCPQSLF